MKGHRDGTTPRVWTTRAGTKIRIREMSTLHIRNCIRMIERYNAARIWNMHLLASMLQGEMAVDAAESDIAHVEAYGFEDWAEDYIYAFEQELERRGYEPGKEK